jgi:hypothetical protein
MGTLKIVRQSIYACIVFWVLSGCGDDGTLLTETTTGTDTDPSPPLTTGTDTFIPTGGELECDPPVVDLEDPAEAGQWSAVVDWSDMSELVDCEISGCEGPGFIAVHAVHLPSGKILFWDGKVGQDADQYLYSIQDETFEYVPADVNRTACAFDHLVSCTTSLDCEEYCLNAENNNCDGMPDFTCEEVMSAGDLFCAGHTHGTSGNAILYGGNITGSSNGWGSEEISVFDTMTQTWQLLEERTHGLRWYPTVTQLGDGRILVHGGDTQRNSIELHDPLMGEVIIRSDHPSDDPQGNPRGLILYPFMFQLPSKHIFYGGGEGLGLAQQRAGYLFDPDLFMWIEAPFPSQIPGGSAVMYQPGRIMKSGGCESFDPRCLATELAEKINVNFETLDSKWWPTCPMHHPRHFHTLTILPDGKVLATGGNTQGNGWLRSYCGNPDNPESVPCDPNNGNADCEVGRCSANSLLFCDEMTPCPGMQICNPPSGGSCLPWNVTEKATKSAELWDPENDQWTELSSQQNERMYHSVALLLPDGRVLSAGGGKRTPDVTDHHNAEFFSPPYLFQGPRPEVQSIPSTIEFGMPFDIVLDSPTSDDVERVTLIRLASVTHQFDMDQRFLELSVSDRTLDTLKVLAPPTEFEAPPGFYMVFVLDDGVPSVGRYVQLQ